MLVTTMEPHGIQVTTDGFPRGVSPCRGRSPTESRVTRMTRDRIGVLATLALLSGVACNGKTADGAPDTGSRPTAPSVATSTASAIASSSPSAPASSVVPPVHSIGDPCVPSDGWNPPPNETGGVAQTVLPDGGISIRLLPVPPGPHGPRDLPPGTAYCDQSNSGGQSANGYWSRTCQADADCPPGSGCSGFLCRKGCQSDSDCGPPTVAYIPICACDYEVPGCPRICNYQMRGGFR